MGECLSVCNREEENNDTNEEGDIKNANGNITPGRTKKNKTRIPKDIVIDDDDDDEDIPITKHISNTIDQDTSKSINLMKNLEKGSEELNEKIKKARKSWDFLINKLVQKRINILREIIKKEKAENESDEEEDEKIEDLKIEKNKDENEEINEKEKNISSSDENIDKNEEEKINKKEKEIEIKQENNIVQ